MFNINNNEKTFKYYFKISVSSKKKRENSKLIR